MKQLLIVGEVSQVPNCSEIQKGKNKKPKQNKHE